MRLGERQSAAPAPERTSADERTPVEAERLAREQAIRLLARREHSRLEVRRKLARRGHAAQVVEDALAALAEQGLQSDARFAASYVRVALARGQGPVKVRADLRSRGIDADGADQALDIGADWTQLARDVRSKRFGEQAPESRREAARQGRFLVGRGFPADVVADLLRSIGSM